jgi:hypothetical protein
VFTLMGFATMWMAVFADTGVSVLVGVRHNRSLSRQVSARRMRPAKSPGREQTTDLRVVETGGPFNKAMKHEDHSAVLPRLSPAIESPTFHQILN